MFYQYVKPGHSPIENTQDPGNHKTCLGQLTEKFLKFEMAKA